MTDQPAPPNGSDPAAVTVPWPRVEQFVGRFAHDVRNGLNAVELQLTLIGEIAEDEEIKTEVKHIRSSLADLTRQIQAVRLATGAPTAHLFPYPAGDFFEDLRERFERQHAGAAARVQWTLAAGTGAVNVDPEQSMTALLELLGNAVQFAVDGSPIRAEAKENAGSVVFSILEQIAAAPADSPEQWGRTPLLSSRRNGYGLGAFRARRIIEAQHGTLRYAYRAEDQSLTTTVELPLAAADEATK